MTQSFGAVDMAHDFAEKHVINGDLCIDATAGRGNDTLFLCRLVGSAGKVLAFDIQEEAIKSTKELLIKNQICGIAEVIKDCHSNMCSYAQNGTVSCIMFNFGWLPGGNHKIFTEPQTSVLAVKYGLELLKPDGIMSLSIYYGKETGVECRDSLLNFLRTIDCKNYTVIISEFANRPNCPPISVFILKGV